MIESKGGESIKGMTIKDEELIEHGARRRRDARDRRPGEHPVLPRGGRHAAGDRHQPALRRRRSRCRRGGLALPGARARARDGERPEPRLGDFREGSSMTRFFSHLVLAPDGDGVLEPSRRSCLEPVASDTGRGLGHALRRHRRGRVHRLAPRRDARRRRPRGRRDRLLHRLLRPGAQGAERARSARRPPRSTSPRTSSTSPASTASSTSPASPACAASATSSRSTCAGTCSRAQRRLRGGSARRRAGRLRVLLVGLRRGRDATRRPRTRRRARCRRTG